MNILAEDYEKKRERFPWQCRNTPRTLITKDPQDNFYSEFPKHFIWDKRNRQWKIRQRQECIGRFYFMGPKAGDLFYF